MSKNSIFSLMLLMLLGISSILAQEVVRGDKKYDWYIKNYPFLDDRVRFHNCESDFIWPEGYHRIPEKNLTKFQYWVSNMPFWPPGEGVIALNQDIKYTPDQITLKVQLPWRSAIFTDKFIPLQLMAEYLMMRGKFDEFKVMPDKGEPLEYQRWLESEIIHDRYGALEYKPSKKREDSREELGLFFSVVNSDVNYSTLGANCDTVSENDIMPGDLLITHNKKGYRGLVYVILNVIQNDRGDKKYLVATGCPEACDFHIPLFHNDQKNPWLTLTELKALGDKYPVMGFYRMKIK